MTKMRKINRWWIEFYCDEASTYLPTAIRIDQISSISRQSYNDGQEPYCCRVNTVGNNSGWDLCISYSELLSILTSGDSDRA